MQGHMDLMSFARSLSAVFSNDAWVLPGVLPGVLPWVLPGVLPWVLVAVAVAKGPATGFNSYYYTINSC